uniref:Ankyrin repeat protein n=1 Tax=Panagrolaimus sp. ES5 TaxID=591445 RepID=A0AC34GW99_9BILA
MDCYNEKILENFLKAVIGNDLNKVKEALKEDKINIMATDEDKNNALILASLYGHFEIIQFLVNEIPENDRKEFIKKGNFLGITPVIGACASGNIQILDLLLNFFNDDTDFKFPVTSLGNTCLGMACANGHPDIMFRLIDAGCRFENVPNSLCPHPLMLAMFNEHRYILHFIYLPSLLQSGQKMMTCTEEIYDFLYRVGFGTLCNVIFFVDIDECCPQFHNLNILALVVIFYEYEMFNLLFHWGANLDAKILSGAKSVRDLAQDIGFYIYPNFSEIKSDESSNIDLNFNTVIRKC